MPRVSRELPLETLLPNNRLSMGVQREVRTLAEVASQRRSTLSLNACSQSKPLTQENGNAWLNISKYCPANEVPRRLPTCGRQWSSKKRRAHAVVGKVVQDNSDPENNAVGAGGRGAPSSAIINEGEKGKGK